MPLASTSRTTLRGIFAALGLWVAVCLSPLAAHADEPLLLGSFTSSTTIENLTGVGRHLFFTVNQSQLWISDATPEGTALLFSGANPYALANLNGTLIFTASSATPRFIPFARAADQLWRSDGTQEGTILLKSFAAIRSDGSSAPEFAPAVLNSSLFFVADDGVHGRELWKTDGTAAGTVLVKDINPGSANGDPRFFGALDGALYFAADDPGGVGQLWRSDGTEAGTIPVPGPARVVGSLTAVNAVLFLVADDGIHGPELWRSDGTPGGTRMVRDLAPPGHAAPANLTSANGVLFFTLFDGVRYGLWTSDGTPEGTTLLREFQAFGSFLPPSGSNGFRGASHLAANGRLFFSADDGIHGRELWTSDGTIAGTALVLDIAPGATGYSPWMLTTAGGRVFFTSDVALGRGRLHDRSTLWASDGTAIGTALVHDFKPGDDGFSFIEPVNVNGTLFLRWAHLRDGDVAYDLYALPVAEAPVRTFLVGLYGEALARAPDAAGLAAWEDFLYANCETAGFEIAALSFFDSLEFRTQRPLRLSELVTVLYRTYLDRDPDAAGLAGWAALFRQARLAIALQGFLPSPEFRGLLPNRADPAAVTSVITRFYAEILGRAPDAAGLEGWVRYVVATGDLEGTAIGFLASPEIEDRALTFRDYVTILYRAFLGRAPDAAGLDGWEAVLRQDLLRTITAGFLPSAEFQTRLATLCTP